MGPLTWVYSSTNQSIKVESNSSFQKNSNGTSQSASVKPFASFTTCTTSSSSTMKESKISPQSRTSHRLDSLQPYPRSKPVRSPRVKLEVGDVLPKVEEQKALQNQLFSGRTDGFGADVTIGHIVKLSHAESKAQTEAAKLRTAHANKKRRAQPPPPITAEQRARGRLLRYIALYEDEYREEILEYMYKMQVSYSSIFFLYLQRFLLVLL
jgi:hypothetical protein